MMTTDRLYNDQPQMSERARRYLKTHDTERAPAAPVAPVAPVRWGGYGGLYRHAPARGFGEAIVVCLSKYFTFSGRASRSEYWYFILFQFFVGIVTAIVDVRYFGADLSRDDAGPASAIASLALVIPFLAVSWRRLHDIGRSGWWIGGYWLAMIAGIVMIVAAISAGQASAQATGLAVLFGLGSLLYSITMLVFLCTRGDPGPNHYG